MKLGIVSDNHGRLEPLRQALGLFDDHSVDAIVHCGDLCGLETLEVLAGRPLWFVWGNMDAPERSWQRFVESIGAHWPANLPVVITDQHKTVAVCHGHERVFERVCSGDYDYVLHGHTHRRADVRRGRTRIVNPGALHRAAVKTVAVLDVLSDELQFLEIGGS